MEEMEVPTEHLHEHIKEAVEHDKGKDRWGLYVAVSTAIMAVLAAVGSLLAGHHSNEALISQLKASDQWAFYQAKGIKYEVLHTVTRLDKSNASSDEIKGEMARYKSEQAEIKEKAEEAQKESDLHLAKHVAIARCVTLFQVSIALSAVAMLTRRRFLWYLSMAITLTGMVLFLMNAWSS